MKKINENQHFTTLKEANDFLIEQHFKENELISKSLVSKDKNGNFEQVCVSSNYDAEIFLITFETK